jgi:hypothetical protein
MAKAAPATVEITATRSSAARIPAAEACGFILQAEGRVAHGRNNRAPQR